MAHDNDMTVRRAVVRRVDGPVARLFAAVFERLARLRGGERALHPRGTTHDAVLRLDPRSAVGAALGGPAERPAVVRISRSIGLPPPWPEVLGVALRAPVGPGTVLDVLFAGISWPDADAVLPARPSGTLLPYRVDGRLLYLGLVPRGDDRLVVTERTPLGPRRAAGLLTLRARRTDTGLAFDPLLHALPRLRPVRLLGRVRELAYTGSRRGRHADTAVPVTGL